jgi:hypothetical protein
VHPDGCRVLFVREVVSDRSPRPDPFQSRPGEGETDSLPAEPGSDHQAPEIVARGRTAFGIWVEMRLGHADNFTSCDSHQYDPVVPGGDHLAGPACSVAGITDHVYLSQVIQGGFTNLHGHSVLGEWARSFVPARKPVPHRRNRSGRVCRCYSLPDCRLPPPDAVPGTHRKVSVVRCEGGRHARAIRDDLQTPSVKSSIRVSPCSVTGRPATSRSVGGSAPLQGSGPTMRVEREPAPSRFSSTTCRQAQRPPSPGAAIRSPCSSSPLLLGLNGNWRLVMLEVSQNHRSRPPITRSRITFLTHKLHPSRRTGFRARGFP